MTAVTLTSDIWLSKFEVTQAEFLELMGNNPSSFKGDLLRPVDSVTWYEAGEFCQRLHDRETKAGRVAPGWKYRLPTEAEWEAAARAGTSTAYAWGTNAAPGTNFAWAAIKSTQRVGTKNPNVSGFHDLFGNVAEWCQDLYGPYPGFTQTDWMGPPAGLQAIVRGGSFQSTLASLRSAARTAVTGTTRSRTYGFRVAYAPDRLILLQTFETSFAPRWLDARVSTYPSGRLLGPAQGGGNRLDLTELPPHTALGLEFDLVLSRYWHGESIDPSPGIWSITDDEGSRVWASSFHNGAAETSFRGQGFPNEPGTSALPPQFGALQANTAGFTTTNGGFSRNMDAVYRLAFTLPHTSPTASWHLSSPGITNPAIAGWGLDNVRIRVFNAPGGTLNFGKPAYAISESGTNVLLDVHRTGSTEGSVAASFATANGTALNPGDYKSTTGVVTFNPGESTRQIVIPIVNDKVGERSESFLVQLHSPQGGAVLGANVIVPVHIQDDDNVFELGVTIAEVHELAGTFSIPVRYRGAAGTYKTVRLTTIAESAEPGADFIPIDQRITFGPSEVEKRISLALPDDTIPESIETLRIELSEPEAGIRIERPVLLVRILDNDAPGFPGLGASGPIHTSVRQPDGSILIGGDFQFVNGAPRSKLARLLPSLSLDTAFDPGSGPNGPVDTLAVDGAGRILVGGRFSTVAGVQRTRLARLHSDGRLDIAFDPGAGANNAVKVIRATAGDGLLVGGTFTQIGGVARPGLARLDANGRVDPDFNATVGSGGVYSLLLEGNGLIVAGGAFTSIAGRRWNRLARLLPSGAADPAWTPGNGFNSTVLALERLPDGALLAAGSFTTANNLARPRLARLLPSGTLDTNFVPAKLAQSAEVLSIAVDPLGGIVEAGTYGAGLRRYLGRIHGSGAHDAAFGNLQFPDAPVRSVLVASPDRLFIAGDFQRLGTATHSRFALLNLSGSTEGNGHSPVELLEHPQNRYAVTGGTLSLSVVASGTEPFQFTWTRDGQVIPGQTHPELVIRGVNPNDAGAYRAIVRNALNSVTSRMARVEVRSTRRVSDVPASPIPVTGFNADLILENRAGATASQPLEGCCGGVLFESGWAGRTEGLPPDRRIRSYADPGITFELAPYAQPNGLRLDAATPNGTLALENPGRFTRLVVLAASGNAGGEGTAVLRFRDGTQSAPIPFAAPSWSDAIPDPLRQPAISGLARAVGGPAWQPDESPASQAGFSLHQSEIGLASRGFETRILESITFSRAPGAETTAILALAAEPGEIAAAGVALGPGDLTVALGASAQFTVSPEGSPPFAFQWRRNGIHLPGETNAVLRIDRVRPDDGGSYSVVVSNSKGAAASRDARLELLLDTLPFADLFARRGVIDSDSGVGSFDTRGTGTEAGEPEHDGKTTGRTAWATYLARENGVLTLHTQGSDFDTLLAVYSGTTLNRLAPIIADDDSGDFFSSRVQFMVREGERFEIAVGGRAGTSGRCVFSWDLDPAAPPPPGFTAQPNDITAAAGSDVAFAVSATDTLEYQWFRNGEPLVDGGRIDGATTRRLTIRGVLPDDLGEYRVKIISDGERLSDPAFLQLDPDLADGGAVAGVASFDKFADALEAGQLASGVNPAGAQGALPAAGRLQGLALGASGTTLFHTGESTRSEAGEPVHCGIPGGASQWTALTVDQEGLLILDTEGSDFDTVLAAYVDVGSGDGLFDGLVMIACNNDLAPTSKASRIGFIASPGTLYLIAIDGVGGATGTATLHRRLSSPLSLSAIDSSPGDRFRMRVEGAPGTPISIEGSSDLNRWIDVLQATLPSTTTDINDDFAPDTFRFYRAIPR